MIGQVPASLNAAVPKKEAIQRRGRDRTACALDAEDRAAMGADEATRGHDRVAHNLEIVDEHLQIRE